MNWQKVCFSNNSETYTSLVISQTSPDTVFATMFHEPTSPMSYSYDNGDSATWHHFDPPMNWPPIVTNDRVCSSPVQDGFYIIAAVDGLMMSDDFLDPFTSSHKGLKPRYNTTIVATNQVDESFILCSGFEDWNNMTSYASFIWKSTDGGDNWQVYPALIHQSEGRITPVHARVVDTNRIYLIGDLVPTFASNGFFVSDNAGETYDTVFLCGIDTSLSYFDIYDDSIVYLIGNKTGNGCYLWQSEYPFLQWNIKTKYALAEGYCLKIHPFVDSHLFFGGLDIATKSCKFWKSTDGGNTYVTPANNGLPTADGNNNMISSLVTSFSTSSRPIIVLSGLKSMPHQQAESIGVYKSTDFGENWTYANIDEEINELKVDPLDPSIVYAATPNGIYVSHDYCGHWISLNQGLEEVANKCDAIDLSTNRPHLFCGTCHGVFKYSPITLLSGISTATGYQAPKMIEHNNQVYFVYQTLGGIYFGAADPNGDIKIREYGAKEGEFPCIALDASDKPCVVWQRNVEISPNQKGGELWFSKYDGYNWTEPHRLVSFVGEFGEDVNVPSLVVDSSTNIGYVTFEERDRYMNGPVSRLYLGWFPIDNPADTHFVQLDHAESPIRCEFPSISLGNNCLYIAFQKDHKIYRIRYDPASCDTTWLLVSNASRYSHHPYVDVCQDGSINYVWEDSTSSDVEIYWAFEDGDSLWCQGNVSQNPRKSQWPQICGGTRWITWSQEESNPVEPTPWNIWYKNLSTPDSGQRITQTTTVSKYSHGVITATPIGGKLTVMYTEGSQSPFEVKVCSVIDSTIDVTPPSAPYVNPVEKSEDDVILTWNKVTTDTLNNGEHVAYYVVYRDTSPSFVPDSLDSIGYVMHPETTFTDTAALSDSTDFFYLVKAVDSASNKSAKSNMGYKLYKFFNVNAGTTDRNWVSLPWHCNYDSVPDLTDDLSPAGDPLIKIANLRDDQLYENWLWDPDFEEWYGDNFDIISGRGYEMITTRDTSLFLVGSNNPNGLVTLNENPNTTDRNWVSIPYNAVYNTVQDITEEYSPSGYPLIKITNLRNDQLYESWLWADSNEGWYGANFTIERGRGYELVTTVDTTWNPTEYSNESGGLCWAISKDRKSYGTTSIGSLCVPDRVPAWVCNTVGDKRVVDKDMKYAAYYCPDLYTPNRAIVENIESVHRGTGSSSTSETRAAALNGGLQPDEREKISHVVRAYILDASVYEAIVFTAYCLDRPKDVLTEKMVGSAVVQNNDVVAVWFDAGNFQVPWKEGEEAILIVEAIRDGKPCIDIENFKLDETVDIQELGTLKLEPSFNSGSQGHSQSLLMCKPTNGNIIGYSLYQDGRRLNERVLQGERSVPARVSVKLVIIGGHETVYSSHVEPQSIPGKNIPKTFDFSIMPNPFVKQTRIDYALPKQTSVDIVIYDVSGRKVKTMASETQSAGYYSAVWNGTNDQGRQVSSGVYFFSFEIGEYRVREKILLVR